MIIIVEGTDKSGKSTLCKHLAEKFNLKSIHCSKPQTNDPYTEYKEMIEKVEDNTIFDRSFLGEYVYANVWRGGCKITFDQFNEIERILIKKGILSIVVYAEAPINTIADRFISEKEEFAKVEEIKTYQEHFNTIIKNCTLPVIRYNSFYQCPQDISEIIDLF